MKPTKSHRQREGELLKRLRHLYFEVHSLANECEDVETGSRLQRHSYRLHDVMTAWQAEVKEAASRTEYQGVYQRERREECFRQRLCYVCRAPVKGHTRCEPCREKDVAGKRLAREAKADA